MPEGFQNGEKGEKAQEAIKGKGGKFSNYAMASLSKDEVRKLCAFPMAEADLCHD